MACYETIYYTRDTLFIYISLEGDIDYNYNIKTNKDFKTLARMRQIEESARQECQSGPEDPRVSGKLI